MIFTDSDKKSAYKDSLKFAGRHYENFPVVSLMVPKKLRRHVAVIYKFARTADDIADEGDFSTAERMQKLNRYEERFTELSKGNYQSAFEYALYASMKEKSLPPGLFLNLLKAFKQDLVKKRYQNYEEILDYCRNSANPVGRLILHLFEIKDQNAMGYSDCICTALQLTNFYQDTMIDYKRGRIYFPEDEMEKFGVSEKMFELKKNNLNLKRLLEYNIARTQHLFNEGKNLYSYLRGMLKFEIKWTVLGGEKVLHKIQKNDFDVFNKRPKLSKSDFLILLLKALSQ